MLLVLLSWCLSPEAGSCPDWLTHVMARTSITQQPLWRCKPVTAGAVLAFVHGEGKGTIVAEIRSVCLWIQQMQHRSCDLHLQ
jgi:hypothetical protein